MHFSNPNKRRGETMNQRSPTAIDQTLSGVENWIQARQRCGLKIGTLLHVRKYLTEYREVCVRTETHPWEDAELVLERATNLGGRMATTAARYPDGVDPLLLSPPVVRNA